MKVATIAVVVHCSQDASAKALSLVEVLSDEHEIQILESSTKAGEENPLQSVHEFRQKQTDEEGEFGDYVEELLSAPFVGNEIQEHGVQWLKSKIRIEKYARTETEAAKTIAEYAMKVLADDPEKTDFFLAGPNTTVRIRVFPLNKSHRKQNLFRVA